MLALMRKAGETIRIGENITVTVMRIGETKVRIGIDAPLDVKVLRGEIVHRATGGTESAPRNVNE